jgi:3-phenylpropionate/trans-cinnamate dioxygenase ferredoxin subunit
MDRIRITALDELPDGRGVRVDVAGRRIALFRLGDDVYAIGDRCSHAEASLAEGEIFDFAVECPRHGSEFSLKTGEPSSFPATRPVPVYHAEVADGDVFVTLTPQTPEEAP